MKKGFKPFLEKNQIPLPVIVYVDGYGSHLSLQTSEFYQENGIVLIALCPNGTHIIQPMDVAIFHPIKQNWRKKVREYTLAHGTREPINRNTFGELLETVL